MAEKVIEVSRDRLNQIAQAIEQGADVSLLRDAMGRVLNGLWRKVARYPAATAANAPGRFRKDPKRGDVPMGYYERGRGWWYPVMRPATLGKKTGVLLGAVTARQAGKRYGVGLNAVAGYKLRATSEALGRHWVLSQTTTGQTLTGRLSNSASYAASVQGSRDDQSRVMASIGWSSVDDVLDEQWPEIEQELDQALDKFIAQL